ncbi:hypothetical protein DLAC_00457 [Tieghemostelium lacteum]|uniref:Uncharacterized protein n=1 Tax=Tieghemostelium lacteum TaxID=361077 RepID=A0A152A9S5_TIELA|nr:hypothetical protein DLAC_00457 [Tieghemostelium lacteum]|eukprot:KYR02973.1 hypothetical protein DLAC_00457 [Tieghemostelium lacteum]
MDKTHLLLEINKLNINKWKGKSLLEKISTKDPRLLLCWRVEQQYGNNILNDMKHTLSVGHLQHDLTQLKSNRNKNGQIEMITSSRKYFIDDIQSTRESLVITFYLFAIKNQKQYDRIEMLFSDPYQSVKNTLYNRFYKQFRPQDPFKNHVYIDKNTQLPFNLPNNITSASLRLVQEAYDNAKTNSTIKFHLPQKTKIYGRIVKEPKLENMDPYKSEIKTCLERLLNIYNETINTLSYLKITCTNINPPEINWHNKDSIGIDIELDLDFKIQITDSQYSQIQTSIPIIEILK